LKNVEIERHTVKMVENSVGAFSTARLRASAKDESNAGRMICGMLFASESAEKARMMSGTGSRAWRDGTGLRLER
jgi:hypothetical protein